MAWVFAESEVTGNDRLVLLAIADEADDDGTKAFPSIDRLAEKCRVPSRTVRRCLVRLEEVNALLVTRPEKHGRGHHNVYTVVMPGHGQSVPLSPSMKSSESDGERSRKGAERGAALANPSYTHRPIDPKSKSKSARPEPLPLSERDVEANSFASFWSTYPRRAGLGAARTAWANACAKADPAILIAGAARYASDPNRVPEFTAHPATWLNRERWEDDPEPVRSAKSGMDPQRDPTRQSGPIAL